MLKASFKPSVFGKYRISLQDPGTSGADKVNSYEYDYNDLITVLVDEDEVELTVHKATICEKSKFFEAAVSSDRWKEGKEKVVRLPEVDSDEFRAYIHWVYTGKFLPEIHWETADVGEHEVKTTYMQGYILADVLDDHELRTHALETLIDKCIHWTTFPSGEFCEDIWEQTPKGSPLRTFLVLFVERYADPVRFFEIISTYPREFLEEFAMHKVFSQFLRCDLSFQEKLRDTVLPEKDNFKDFGSHRSMMTEMLKGVRDQKRARAAAAEQAQAEGEAGAEE
jgi:hypothetical protein